MAVTIEQSPEALTPSDNDVLWVFSSNRTGQQNFEFKVELYIDGVNQGEDKVYPTDGANAYYDASEKLKPLFSTPVIPTDITITSDLVDNSLSTKSCYIVVTEVYGDPQSDQEEATSSTIDVFKASLSDDDFINFFPIKYLVGASGAKQFMTNFNRNKKYWVDTRKSNYISFYIAVSDSYNIKLTTHDISGNIIDTQSESIGTLSKGMYNINVSKKEYTSLNWSGAYYYTVTLTTTFSVIEVFKFYIHEPCTSDRTVYFINKLGGIDSWIFSKKKEVTRDFSRKTFKRKFGSLSGSSYNYSAFEGRDVNYMNESERKLSLMSDWNDPDVQSWLVQELLESPIVWMEDSLDRRKRYNIENSSEGEPQDRYVELQNLTVELKDSLISKSAIY